MAVPLISEKEKPHNSLNMNNRNICMAINVCFVSFNKEYAMASIFPTEWKG
jgi:hypothetical protein